MPEKAQSKGSKSTTAKKGSSTATAHKKTSGSTPKRAGSKSKFSKGQAMSCEVCGLVVTVDEVGDEVYEEEAEIICCGKPMQARGARKASARA